MYYEINVSLNGKHFFATSERSITSEQKLLRVLSKLRSSFSFNDGYEISVTAWQKIGKKVNL